MIKKIIWALIFIIVAAVLQSTILRQIELFYAVPDLALGILVFVAYSNGAMAGQVTGFFSGIIMDFLSSAPLGFNALVRTLIGGLVGFMQGTFYMDTFLLPMSLCAGATIFKALCGLLLHLIFSSVPAYDFTVPLFWVELGLNTVTAPLLFLFLKLFKTLLTGERKTR
ncbi:MAG: rod shape-determining protein MreD [Treponema sp.]|nr:rod shape-determining protein MreD [Treponema sp.]